MHFVPLYHLHVLTCHALLSAQSAYPGIKAPESTGQRLQLANLAAAMATLDGVVEQVDALFPYHALHLPIVREKHLQLDIVCQVGFVNQLVGLRKEPTCIECKDACSPTLHDDIRKCLVLNRQR